MILGQHFSEALINQRAVIFPELFHAPAPQLVEVPRLAVQNGLFELVFKQVCRETHFPENEFAVVEHVDFGVHGFCVCRNISAPGRDNDRAVNLEEP